MKDYWTDFIEGIWCEKINVEDFIKKNFNVYNGDDSFLKGISSRTKNIWNKCTSLIKEEIKVKVLDIDLEHISGVNNFPAGYIDKENELIVGLQTDAPLKRIVNPYGGIKMAEQILNIYGKKLDSKTSEIFNKMIKTHNQGVFDAYTKEIRLARKSGLITGLPDAYGRGRIIGDYRRVTLYGIDFLIEEKQKDQLDIAITNDESIKLREELSEQIRVLDDIKQMALKYGYDISKPAKNSKEAVQWLYFAYLASVKENNGAAMSLGRTSTFLDIYFERDLKNGNITEEEIQELIDQFIIKLRLVRHLRTPDYDELFAGDPTWVTESIGGITIEGIPLVTKTSFRYLHSLDNLGSAPEPNLTILWSEKLPENFKKYCTRMSIKTGSLQYESDDIMRPIYGDDYAISCCVSAMKLGKQMQYFGARCNLAKVILYTINGGYDEISGVKVIDGLESINDEVIDYNSFMEKFKITLSKTVKTYVDAMNIIHYMHDKYAYEKSQMALHDTYVERLMAFGIAGLSVAVDSLSAIKYAKVSPVRNEKNISVDFKTEGEFPKFGNDDDKVDNIATELVNMFITELRKHKLYRNAKHTLSVLTITSNVVYGHKTGVTPDGRGAEVPFAPGANPMHGRDKNGALASLNSVAKIPYENVCEDGVSNTFSIIPNVLGKTEEEREDNLVNILDGYFNKKGHHLNVNVYNRETLIDAMKYPEKYSTLTIRVSGYAVNFVRLNRAQQEEVLSRTFHEVI